MVRNTPDHLGQVGLRVYPVELGRLDQAVNGGGALAASIGASEQPVLAAQSDTAYRSLSSIVVYLDAPIVQVAGQGRPACNRVANRFGQSRLGRYLCQRILQPALTVAELLASMRGLAAFALLGKKGPPAVALPFRGGFRNCKWLISLTFLRPLH